MERPINIAICEDNEQQLEINKHYIEQWAQATAQQVNIMTYLSAESFLFSWEYEVEFDILFLDIRMGQMSGVELAHHIRTKNQDITIIFITGESKYVFEGYEVKALNYLMKPIKSDAVFRCLNTWLTQHSKKENEYFVIKKGKELLKLKYDAIYYFISFDHYIDIHLEDEVITFKEKMSNIEKILPQNRFCRCHRSYIVNVKLIDQITKNEIYLENGMKIPISKSRSVAMYDAFMKYFCPIE